MLIFVSIVHVLLCVFMIFVILLQPGKDAGMGAALGGGAATSAFGGRGAVTFLTKVTAVCAIGFFITALGLSFVGLRTSVAAGGEQLPAAAAPAPVSPAAPAPESGVEKGSAAPAVDVQPGPAPGTEAVPAEKLPPAPAQP
ncbi:MAG: preprotein translocase subunit SecG [Myxococcota bacterium]